jgi:hypothetical protein
VLLLFQQRGIAVPTEVSAGKVSAGSALAAAWSNFPLLYEASSAARLAPILVLAGTPASVPREGSEVQTDEAATRTALLHPIWRTAFQQLAAGHHARGDGAEVLAVIWKDAVEALPVAAKLKVKYQLIFSLSLYPLGVLASTQNLV